MWPPTDRSRLASLGLPALIASDPGRSHRERVVRCNERPHLAQGSEAAAPAAIAALFVARGGCFRPDLGRWLCKSDPEHICASSLDHLTDTARPRQCWAYWHWSSS
jgi:hypothetical protein